MLSARPLAADEHGPLCLVVLHNLTEYKNMEETIKRQEGLSRVGEFVSAINHEIRNVVQPLRAVMQRMQNLNIADATYQEIAGRIPDRMGALDGLLNNLKNYSRPIELRRRMLNIRNVVSAVLLGLERKIAQEDIKVEQEYGAAAEQCFADGDWLGQVLVNLVKNALEATAGCARRVVRISTRLEDRLVVIQVEDTGAGIKLEDRKRLFQPFFTTKGERGTGLGLSICQKIVELHDGQISVWSQPGLGTRFSVHLPADQEGAAAEAVSKQMGSREG